MDGENMVHPAISRANFHYATKLRARGCLTAVHALPMEARQFVDKLLEEGLPSSTIANKLYEKFGPEILLSGLKPISNHSIQTYRDNYWKKSAAFARVVIQGDEETKKRADDIRKDFDAYVEVVEAVKLMKEMAQLAVDRCRMVKMPISIANNLLISWFVSAQKILEYENSVGLRTPVLPEPVSNIKENKSIEFEGWQNYEKMTDEQKSNWLEKQRAYLQNRSLLLDAMTRTGRYRKRELQGEVIGPVGLNIASSS